MTIASYGALVIRLPNHIVNLETNTIMITIQQMFMILGFWRGTSNKLPRLIPGNNYNYLNISDIYMEDADFFRLQILLGYDFKSYSPRAPFQQARLYVTAQNLFTITGYSGMDPEIGASGDETNYSWGSGIDLGFYPSPRTFLVGVNLKF
ncbi:MAG: TonB-dependent receptor [Bacteroides graminisolvens]